MSCGGFLEGWRVGRQKNPQRLCGKPLRVKALQPVPPRGDELPQETQGNTHISDIGGAESGAVDAAASNADFLRARWPGLTDQAIRRITSLIMVELDTSGLVED